MPVIVKDHSQHLFTTAKPPSVQIHTAGMGECHAFTLIELLVVISIIAVLF